jgi:hypothetical protein
MASQSNACDKLKDVNYTTHNLKRSQTYYEGENDANTPPVEGEEEGLLEVPDDPADSSADDDDIVVQVL